VKELRQKALKLLARREHSRAELARKLAALGTQEDIDAVLGELERSNLLSDARVADAYLRSHANRFGAARLRQGLHAKGIDRELVDQQLAASGLPDEMSRARLLWSKKYGAIPADRTEWAKQARFMQARGFSTDVIRRLLQEPDES
jgi:regulatory protein